MDNNNNDGGNKTPNGGLHIMVRTHTDEDGKEHVDGMEAHTFDDCAAEAEVSDEPRCMGANSPHYREGWERTFGKKDDLLN